MKTEGKGTEGRGKDWKCREEKGVNEKEEMRMKIKRRGKRHLIGGKGNMRLTE